MTMPALLLLQAVAMSNGYPQDRREWTTLSIASVDQVVEALQTCEAATVSPAVDQGVLANRGWKMESERRAFSPLLPEAFFRTFSRSGHPSKVAILSPIFADSCIVMSKMPAGGAGSLQRALEGQGARPAFRKSLRLNERLIDIETISDSDTAKPAEPVIVRAFVARLPEGLR